MPGSVQNASPQGVLPTLPIYGFSETREYLGYENRYANGESERYAAAATSRRAWKIRWRLTSDQVDTFKTFFDAHGKTVPFYCTPLNESTQVAAKFNSDWQQQAAWANRVDVTLDLIQVT